MILKCFGKEIECECIEKGEDYIICFMDGVKIARFSGITDFSAFKISGGEWPSAPLDPVDVLGAQVAQLSIDNMQKDQIIDALGAQLAQTALEVMKLKNERGM